MRCESCRLSCRAKIKMRSIRPSQAYFKLCLDEDSAHSSFINHHDFGKEWGLQMTLQVKGVQIAKISALTIRNMLRGVNELVCPEYVAQRCKVPLRRAKQIVRRWSPRDTWNL